jgi:hypothetical protein
MSSSSAERRIDFRFRRKPVVLFTGAHKSPLLRVEICRNGDHVATLVRGNGDSFDARFRCAGYRGFLPYSYWLFRLWNARVLGRARQFFFNGPRHSHFDWSALGRWDARVFPASRSYDNSFHRVYQVNTVLLKTHE